MISTAADDSASVPNSDGLPCTALGFQELMFTSKSEKRLRDVLFLMFLFIMSPYFNFFSPSVFCRGPQCLPMSKLTRLRCQTNRPTDRCLGGCVGLGWPHAVSVPDGMSQIPSHGRSARSPSKLHFVSRITY